MGESGLRGSGLDGAPLYGGAYGKAVARLDPFFLGRNRQFDFNQRLFDPFDIGFLIRYLHHETSSIMEPKGQAARMQTLEPPDHILHFLEAF